MLRNAAEASDPEGCPKEESFKELYAERENKERQNQIRRQFPDKHHCIYLEHDNNCCDVFSYPGVQFEKWIGKVCPLNPKHPERISKEREKFHISKRDDQLIAIAANISRDARMDPRIISSLTVEEYYAAIVYQDHQDFQNMKTQAKLIALEVSKLFKKK